jgi:hypothetical protein
MPLPSLIRPRPAGSTINAHTFTDARGGEYFFSYATCIAFSGFAGNGKAKVFVEVRLANTWGRTTGGHFSELGCKDFEVVSTQQFEDFLLTA